MYLNHRSALPTLSSMAPVALVVYDCNSTTGPAINGTQARALAPTARVSGPEGSYPWENFRGSPWL